MQTKQKSECLYQLKTKMVLSIEIVCNTATGLWMPQAILLYMLPIVHEVKDTESKNKSQNCQSRHI